MKKIAVVTVALLTIILIVSGCSRKGEETGKTKVNITINSWIGFAPLYLAKEKGLLGNTELELTRVEDTGARKSTMIAGKVDGYASSLDNFSIDSTEGVKGKIVLCFDESYGADGIVVKKNIKAVNDLKGKQVAFQKGMPSHFLLLSVLDKGGLTVQDITQIDMDADKAGAAFTSGKLDAAVTWEPWISKAAAMSGGKILITTKDFPGLIVDVLVFRDEVMKSKRNSIRDIVDGWFRALEFWKTRKAESDEIMAKSMGLKVGEFNEMVSGVRFFDAARNKEYFGTNEKKGQIYSVFEKASDLWLKSGIIKAKSNPDDVIDSAFIEDRK